jgi:cytochrome oxidase Cu insertion factor (SCO1/SenC/PrrC family)
MKALVIGSVLFAALAVSGNTEIMLGSPDSKIIGAKLPNVELLNERNEPAPLYSLRFEGPVVLLPIFTHCASTCPVSVAHLKEILARQKTYYNVILFSFDPKDGPAEMVKYRKDLEIPAQWQIFSADILNTQKLLDALDFRYMSQGPQFVHPNSLFILNSYFVIRSVISGISYSDEILGSGLKKAIK